MLFFRQNEKQSIKKARKMKRDKIKTGKFRNRLKMQLKDYIGNKLKLNSMTKTLKK